MGVTYKTIPILPSTERTRVDIAVVHCTLDTPITPAPSPGTRVSVVEVYFHNDFDYPGRPDSEQPTSTPWVTHASKEHQHDVTTLCALRRRGYQVEYFTCVAH